ncbi:MAG: hypothetical protein WAO93_09960 [Orrella sp.]
MKQTRDLDYSCDEVLARCSRAGLAHHQRRYFIGPELGVNNLA